MKKFLGELLASILIVVMTVGSLPNMSYADELLVSTDAYYSETEEGPEGTELIEENLEETDAELPEEISEEGEEESLPAEEVSEDESVAEGEEILGEEETVLEDEILGEEEELLDEESAEGELSDEELLSDELLEEAFNSEAEDAVNPADYLFIEGTTVKGFIDGWKPYANGVSKIVIPEGITEIGDKAFYATDKDMLFNSIVLPSTLKTIGTQAFYHQWVITSVSIPSGVTKIGAGAFSECTNITEINIPNGVTEIEDNVFDNANRLEKVTLGNRVTRIGKRAFASTAIQAITIPKSVKSIGESAFEKCGHLKNINIPTGVTEIEDSLFLSCSELTSITIPKTVTSIGDKAFRYCTKLETLPFSSGVKTIGEYAFSSCGIETLVIPDCVTSIGKYAFSNNSSLKSVTIGKNVSHMGERVFSGDKENYLVLDNLTVKSTKLEDVTESNSNGQLVYPFWYVKVKSLVFDDAVTYIPSNTFNHIDLSECDVIIPANVTSIHHHAFSKTKSDKENKSNIIKSISFAGNKVIEIGDSAFEYSEIPSGVRLPDSVENIGEKAFFNCDFYPYSKENPLKVFLPQNLKKIQANAFAKFGNKDYYECVQTNFAEKNKSANMYFYVPADMQAVANNAFGSRYGLGDASLDDPIYRMNFVVEGDSTSKSVELLTAVIKAQESEYSYAMPSDRISYDGSEKKYCKINYVLNGGVFKSRTPESGLISGEQIKFLGYPSKTGYVFDGWYSDSKLKNKVEIADGKTLATDGYELSKDTFKTDVSLYAKWKLVTYTVKFDFNAPGNENGDTVKGTMSDQTLTYSKATALRKNAYSFAKWKFTGWNTKADGTGVKYKNAASVKNLASEQDAEVTLYAQWQPLTYTVKFDGNTSYFGGKVSGKMPAVKYSYYTDLGKVLPTNKFTCPGMTFKGWRLQSDLDAAPEIEDGYPNNYDMEELATQNKNVVTLYAVWERNKYTVEIYYDDASSTTPFYSSEFEYGYTLAEAYKKVEDKEITSAVPNWCILNNFTTLPKGKGKKYTINSRINSISGDKLILYYAPKYVTHKLEVNMNGGKGGIKLPKTYTHNTAPFILAQADKLPTRDGYKFLYFDTTRDDHVIAKNKINAGDYFDPQEYDNNSKIVAKWAAINYTVELNPASASYIEGVLEDKSSQTLENTKIITGDVDFYDESTKILNGTWKQKDDMKYYSITGWSTKDNGKGKVFANINKVPMKDLYKYADADGKIKLYAIWAKNKYNIIYDLDGGTLSSAPKTYTYNEKKAVKIGTPKKAGYKFVKWQPTYGMGCFDSDLGTIKAGADCNIKLVAVWKAVEYTVVISPNSKMATIDSVYKTEEYPNIPYYDTGSYNTVAQYRNPGYTFAGYNTKANGKGIKVQETSGYYNFSGLSTKDGSTVTVYAQWTPNTYNVTYNAVDPTTKGIVNFSNWVSGYASNNNPSTYTYAPKGTITLKTPVKYGYVFEGWYEKYDPSSKTFSNKVTKIDRSVNKDVVLYAKWRVK